MSRYDDETLKHLQEVELRILRDVDRVCRDHGIPYFLDSGSALGAIRHNGFIPWDDDVDVGMLRADYDRFLDVAADALGPEYFVSSPRTNPHQSALFTKVWLVDTKFYTDETLRAGVRQGIGIDVFPYDPLSAQERVASSQISTCIRMQRAMYLYHSASVVVPHKGALGAAERLAAAAAHAVCKVAVSREKLMRRFDEAAAQGASNPSGDWFCPAYPTSGRFPLGVLAPVQRHDFEGESFPVPAQAERYLQIMFGDWRKLPPEDQRRQHKPTQLDFGPY